MVIFILGCIIYFLMLFGVLYWIFTKNVEDFFYRSVFCTLGMSLLSLILQYEGENIFSNATLKWLSIASSLISILLIVTFFIRFFSSFPTFEVRTVVFFFPFVISGYVIAYAIAQDKIWKNLADYISLLVGGCCILFTILTKYFHKKREDRLRAKIGVLEQELRYGYYDINYISRKRYGRQELYNIEQVLTELYMRLQDRKLTLEKVHIILRRSDIPSDLTLKITNRLFSDDLISRVPFLNLADFLQELLPEVFANRRAYHSSSVDIRYYEDLYEKLKYSMNTDNNRAIEEINQKIDSLNLYLKKNLQSDTGKTNSAETYGSQNQIRELFHALETPIATSEMALTTLKASFETLTERQEGKFERIQNTIKLIKSILFAYRELTVMNIYSDENTFFSLPEIINSIPSLMAVEKTNIILDQKDVPDHIQKYSTNLIVVLLLPLIHNAVEASPDHKPILVECFQSEKGCTFKIENYCKQTPRQINLDTEGYSTKGNNHTGTGISIVRRISKSVGVDFELNVCNNKVSAKLFFPKQ